MGETKVTSKTAFSQVTIGDRKSSEYGTPLPFFNELDSIFDFILDPCALSSDPSRLGLAYYTKAENGLNKEWKDNTFVNPPFGTKKSENIRAWIDKMMREAENHPFAKYVMLLPARIEAGWFQDTILNWRYLAGATVWLYAIRGRLSFYNPETNKNGNPHPIGSVLFIVSGDLETDCGEFKDLENEIPGKWLCLE